MNNHNRNNSSNDDTLFSLAARMKQRPPIENQEANQLPTPNRTPNRTIKPTKEAPKSVAAKKAIKEKIPPPKMEIGPDGRRQKKRAIACPEPDCGKEFTPVNVNQKKCPDCIKRINMQVAEVAMARQQAEKAEKEENQPESHPTIPELSILPPGPGKRRTSGFPIHVRREGPAGPINNEEMQEFMRCVVDKKYFLDTYAYMLDPVQGKIRFHLFEYQRDALDDFDDYRFNVILKPRQMGISWLVAGDALHIVLFNFGKKVLMISKKEKDAVKLLNKSKYIYENLPLFLRVPDKEMHQNEQVLKFTKMESMIESVPSDPNAGRSEGLSLLIMDEAAFIPDATSIWKAAYYTLSTGGAAILLSTANGVGNLFHEVWSKAIKGENDFNTIKLHWRMFPGRDDEWYETQLRNTSKKDMAQEVDCNFLQSGSPVFDAQFLFDNEGSPILLASNTTPLEDYGGLTIYQRPIPGRRYLKGVDSSEGGGTDYCQMLVLDAETLDEVATLRGKWAPGVYGEKIDALSRMYPGPLGVERTGMGLAVVVRLQDLGTPDLYYHEEIDTRNMSSPKAPRPGWVTSSKSKPVMIGELEEAVRNAWIRFASRIYADEMLVYTYLDEKGKMGAAKGYNDDSVMAAAIAWQMRKYVSRLQFGGIAM
ncbi:MAG: hypothetical protein VR68_11665 [Peptococcaceae bacterium BRH_c4a]|nr:MAG: hypothetical protein VR68_11665 [Peptococcaceae bacterium BRH_c4a]